VYITPANGCRFQGRFTLAGDATADTGTAEDMAITAPYWVKIERDASNNFNGYYSSDGVNWVAMSWNPRNTAMPADVYIGLALTSHNSGVNCTAVFSNVQTTGTVSPQTWMQEAIGVEMPSNEAEQMYVVLNGSAVVYNGDPDAALTDEWTEWPIELQEFADQGVDLIDVSTLGIGFGDRDNPQPGGSGVVYFDDIRLYSPEPPEPEGLMLENASFELPGTEKQIGFDNVPGWSSDTEVADSGVESDWPGSTDGAWAGFMMGSDPSIWNLTDHVIASGDEFILLVDLQDNWTDGGEPQVLISLHYDDAGARVTVASATVTPSDQSEGGWSEFSVSFAADDVPDSIGKLIGIEIDNVSETDSWIGIDNLRLVFAE